MNYTQVEKIGVNRKEVTLEVYNQKQNTLFIFECVEHRMFKVTWEYCVDSKVRTTECTFRTYARPSARFRMGAQLDGS